MALIGSLNSGISALRNFARGLEVIGNNIANVNSIAFKGARTKYTDTFSQFLKQPSTSPADGNGSNSPAAQIGLGTQISGIQTSFLQGALTTTGQNTDLAIAGSGFFQVRNAQNNQLFATRAGDFRTDDQGYITTSDGYRLQGLTGGTVSYRAAIDPDGNTVFLPTISPPQTTGDLRIDFDATFENGRLTNAPILVDANGNPILDAGGNEISALSAFTSATFTAEECAVNGAGQLVNSNGDVLLGPDGNPVTGVGAGTYLVNGTNVAFGTNDAPVAAATGEYLTVGSGATLRVVLNDAGGAVAGTTGNYVVDQNGELIFDGGGNAIPAPTDAQVLNDVPKMIAFKFRTNGDLEVSLSNGASLIGGRVLLMDFRDPTALVREGSNLYSGFDAAGVIGSLNLNATENTPGAYGLGTIQGGSLELSNVDLTEQFAELITTQRSFQAGSRIITVSDDILQEVVNLKR